MNYIRAKESYKFSTRAFNFAPFWLVWGVGAHGTTDALAALHPVPLHGPPTRTNRKAPGEVCCVCVPCAVGNTAAHCAWQLNTKYCTTLLWCVLVVYNWISKIAFEYQLKDFEKNDKIKKNFYYVNVDIVEKIESRRIDVHEWLVL